MYHIKQEEGSVKFDCHLEKEVIVIPQELFFPLNYWRKLLWDNKLIGVYPDGIGYGNISVRLPGSDLFYISGTSTGSLPDLRQEHYSLVEQCDPEVNSIRCRGLIKASAESMSHSAIYLGNPEALAVVHIHNRELWEKYRNSLPTTDDKIAYGTPEMAEEIGRIMKLPETLEKKVIVMGGHEEGLISFGKTVEEAAQDILSLK